MRPGFPPGSLPDGLAARIETHYAQRPFSLAGEVRALLSLGILSLSAGLGMLVYEHIDTIGHQAILAAIALGALACFAWCRHRGPAFTWARTPPSFGIDALALLGCLLTGIFAGYLQARYAVFGSRVSLALALPAAAYVLAGYRFDHRGALQLGIAGLCAAAGVAVSPLGVLRSGFDARLPAFTGLLLAAVWGALAWISDRRGRKAHFAFTFGNSAAHLFFVSALAAQYARTGVGEWVHFLLAAGGAAGLFAYARRLRSPYFALIAVIYGYVAVTAVVFRHILVSGWASAELGFLYFVASCIGAIRLFLDLKTLAGAEGRKGKDGRHARL
jgi:hypothetical protein